MNAFYNRVRRFSAIILGLVFFVAGTLKLMDPVGAGLIVEEYLHFFGMDSLSGASKAIGAGAALLETITGAALVTGVFRKLFAIIASALTVIFTIVTFILWRKNPEFDCGCFGEAIHLSHLQSLLKNLVLLVLAAIAFTPFKSYGTSRGGKKVSFFIICCSSLLLLGYSWINIPFRDFTPFNYSSRILAAELADPMSDDADAVTVFIYEKGGQRGSFTSDNLPDSTWTFIASKTMLKEDNYNEDRFPELPFTDAEGQFCDSLATAEYLIVCSVPDPAGLNAEGWKEAARLIDEATEEGFTPLLLLTAEPGTIEEYLPGELSPQEKYLLTEASYYSPYKTLISLNRSNGGATYFNEGDLVNKWPSRNLPDREELGGIHRRDMMDLTISADTKGKLKFEAWFLYSIAILFLV